MERRKIWLVGALAFALLASEFVPDEGGGSRLTAGQAVSADEPVASPTPGSFFVSPQGNNSWSGRLAAPGDNDGPFATIVWAREAVRALLKTQEQPRLVPILMAAGAAKVQGASDSQSDSLKEKSMLLGTESKRTFASGPLWVGKRNPRYFEDVQGRIVYLTGSHTWSNLQDIGPTDPSPAFNFDAHLDFLKKHHHNFIRLWRWELPKWTERDKRIRYCAPHSWKRTGPGEAFDGKPKFDLHQLDPAYFDRLRSRVVAAGKQGIYVSIMLFEGWGLSFASWDGHPFNVHNNLQGINGDPNGDGKGTETHTLTIPAVTEFQEAYVRKVIDTVNDLDNVLFEMANESNFDHSKDWQYHIVHYVKDYEKKKPKQHPVGITGFTRSDNKIMTDSPADWVSLGGTGYTHEEGPFKSDPPTADGKKVSLLDTDHIWGVGGGREWVWKSFLRGHNPIWMDPYDDSSAWEPLPPNAEDVRRNLGDARRYAERIDLAVMTPSSQLASTKYCLANAGSEYLVYLPDGGSVTVDLTNAQGDFAVEWQNAATGKDVKANTVPGGARREFNAPFDGDAVLILSGQPASSCVFPDTTRDVLGRIIFSGTMRALSHRKGNDGLKAMKTILEPIRVLLAAGFMLVLQADSKQFRSEGPLFRTVELDVGESQNVELSDGKKVNVKVLDLEETRDDLCSAVRRARVKVEVNRETVTLTSATYHLPVTIANVQIDCPITKGYLGDSEMDNWGLAKDVRLRLWPAGSPWISPDSFVYPVRQRWFASMTQMANEPVFVDGGDIPGGRKIYYHYGLDIGGSEGGVEVVSATHGLVVSLGRMCCRDIKTHQ